MNFKIYYFKLNYYETDLIIAINSSIANGTKLLFV